MLLDIVADTPAHSSPDPPECEVHHVACWLHLRLEHGAEDRHRQRLHVCVVYARARARELCALCACGVNAVVADRAE